MDSEFKHVNDTALKIAEDKVLWITKNIQQDLQIYARAHRRSGDLLRNIKYKKGDNGISYIVDAGRRKDYRDKTYHALTFFINEKANDALSKTINKARDSLK